MRFQFKIYLIHFPFFFVFCFESVISQTLHETEGFASYYSEEFNGRQTSNGEIYDMNKLTAAHPYLPFNTWVRVTNVANQKSVTVRINDRGPFARNRIIDLSFAAAKALGMLGPGSIYVKLEIISPPFETENEITTVTIPQLEKDEVNLRFTSKTKDQIPAGSITDYGLYDSRFEKINSLGYVIQLASFSELKNAKLFLDNNDDVDRNELYIYYAGPSIYRIVVGVFSNKQIAENRRNELSEHYPGCFVLTFGNPK